MLINGNFETRNAGYHLNNLLCQIRKTSRNVEKASFAYLDLDLCLPGALNEASAYLNLQDPPCAARQLSILVHSLQKIPEIGAENKVNVSVLHLTPVNY